MVGVVCHEHVGPKRLWTKDEETFAYLILTDGKQARRSCKSRLATTTATCT